MGRNPHLVANSAEVIAEQERCYELRLEGRSIREIARLVGKSPQTVQNRLNDEWVRRVSPLSDRLRDEDLSKLDDREWRILCEIEAISVGDNPDAIVKLTNTYLNIVDKRAKIGGYLAPTAITLTNGSGEVPIPPAVREAIRRAEESNVEREAEIRGRDDGG